LFANSDKSCHALALYASGMDDILSLAMPLVATPPLTRWRRQGMRYVKYGVQARAVG
jgi:hypothetical protein